MDVKQRPVVTPSGDINIHARSGLTLSMAFQDSEGAARDVSAAAIYFEVEGLFRIELDPGAASDERVAVVTDEQAAELFAARPAGARFAFRDESGVEPDVFWSGSILPYGFKDQPE